MITAGHDDPVQRAQDWLAEHGGVVPRVSEHGVSEHGVSEHGVNADTVLGDPLRTARPAPAASGRDDEPDADAEAVARTIVLAKLAGRPQTRHELERALAAKAVPEGAVRAVLDRLESAGMVDDAAFAELWVASRQQRRHLSSVALRRELRARGVDTDRIDSALDGVDTEDERLAARGLVDKKLRALGGISRSVQYRRLAAALGRRGFGSDVIKSVLSEALGDS